MPNTREKLIELLNKKYDHYCDQCGVNKDSHYTENLADFLVAHGVTVQQWIPVTERLPEKTGLVLGYDIGFGVLLLYYEVGSVRSGWQSVTHWMPLPTPPKP